MAFSTNQKEVTYATLVGYEPALFKASDEALFTDPLDGAVVPKLQKKRFPSLATLRAEKASVELLYAVGSEHVVHADDRCYQKTSLGSMCQKDVVESMAKTSALQQEVWPASTQGAHLAGAAALGLRKSPARLQNTHFVPHEMMQTMVSGVAFPTKVSQEVKVPMQPTQPSAAPVPPSTGKGKRPIPSNMRVLIVPGIR